MKRAALMLPFAALILTACTDQPTAPEPLPTATVTETVTADPADALPSEEHIVETIASILQQPDATVLPKGAAALEEFSTAFRAVTRDEEAEDTPECTGVFETQPEVAGYGTADSADETTDDEDAATEDHTTSGLAAMGFESPADAAALTEELKHFVETCAESGTEIDMLTHHTDEAFEVQVEHSDDVRSSVVIVRNTHWVFAASSTPASEVGLTLSLVDQLDEMLR